MARNEMTIKGLAEVHAALKGLPSKVRSKVLREAARAGARVLASAVERNVPVGETGFLRIHVALALAGLSRNGYFSGVKIESGHAAAVEFGTGHGGADPGGQAAQHYMQRGLDGSRDQVERTIADEVKQGIEAEAGRG